MGGLGHRVVGRFGGHVPTQSSRGRGAWPERPDSTQSGPSFGASVGGRPAHERGSDFGVTFGHIFRKR